MIDTTKKEMLNRISQVKDDFDIMRKTKVRPFVYRRFYFTNFVFQNRHKLGLETLKEVAAVVGYRSHDNVIYAVKQHEALRKDSVYMLYASKIGDILKQIVPDSVELRELKTLEEQVMACDNYWELIRLQTTIKNMNPEKWNITFKNR